MIEAVVQPAPGRIARLRRWLSAQRPRRSAPALLLAAVLAVSLGEPLACIFHCQLWLPAYFAAAGAHSHGHHSHHHGHGHQHGVASTHRDAPAVAATAHDRAADTHAGGCALRPAGSPSSAPYHLPPSPVHEAVVAAAPLLMALLLAALLALPPILAPPRLGAPPLLTPPRSHVR
jgi:hypothetical protein